MTILPSGVAVSGTTHHAEWVRHKGLVHEKELPAVIRKHVHSGDICIDVGAHIGSLTRVMLDQHAEVYAFEPNFDSYLCLKHNCPAAHSSLLALSDEIGIRPFRSNPDNSGASRFDERTEETVVTDTLDSLRIKHADFIKIDCEGAEVRVLRGGRILIQKCRPKMLIEVNRDALKQQLFTPEQLFAWLDLHGYDWEIVQENCGIGDPQYDIFCKSK